MSNTKTVMGQAANTQGIPLDITDVFSTYLYTGNGATQTINNGIDLAGEGGLVWVKNRDRVIDHALFDTERGANRNLKSDQTAAENYNTTINQTFNSDGFGFNNNYTDTNYSGEDFVSWTFRKAPKFFDVVTYTGNGVAGREIAHNLGSVPGMIVVKCLNNVTNWAVYHRGVDSTAPEDFVLRFNDTTARVNTDVNWNDTAPTSTNFTLGTNSWVNRSGDTYVAYLFAHNNGDGDFGPTGDQDIIKCGSYVGNDSSNGPEIDLGFEPQWVMIKNADGASDWVIHDTMRGWVNADGNNDARLFPNTSGSEATFATSEPTATGFKIKTTLGQFNTLNQTYIYMAIRRGPLAQPESGTEVFETKTYSGTGAAQTLTTSLNGSDMALTANRSNSGALNPGVYDRLRGDEYLQTSNTSAAIASDSYGISVLSNKQNTVDVGNFASTSGQTYVGQIFKRAPGFCDVVAYTGDSTAGRTVSHNLGVAPEMMWVKPRSAANPWQVYHSATGNTKALNFDTGTGFTSINYWNNTTPSSSDFTLGSSVGFNGSGVTYIAYLFATLPGVSKVGSYTGNGTSQTIDCGFTSGARFILIKRTDSTGDWYIWDTERGIVAGNDPHLSLNTTAAEVTSDDSIDPDNSGFIVNQVGATNINVSSATYIFYAIA